MKARTNWRGAGWNRRRGGASAALAIAMALALGAAGAGAFAPVGSDFRISNIGPDGVVGLSGINAAVAYNPTANEYLAVWTGEPTTNNEFEIFGQRLGPRGAEIGSDFQISDANGAPGARMPNLAQVAYNPNSNQYLVVWHADGPGTADDEFEIFGQRLSAAGAEIGADDFQISEVGPDGDPARLARAPAVVHNPQANEYLVSWSGDHTADDEREIFGQRLSAAGVAVGPDNFQISDLGIDASREAWGPMIAYNSTANEYLVAWEDDRLADDVNELFGQRLSATGAEIGTDDFRISNTTEAGSERDASVGSVAHNPMANQYLVTWYGDGLETDGESEIFGQRLTGLGAELASDFRISRTGADGDPNRNAFAPRLVFNRSAGEYLVTWYGDGLPTDHEFEVFARRLSAAGGGLGTEFRVSSVGPDGDNTRWATRPDVAHNPALGEYLVVWSADDLPTPDEREIFGRRIAPPRCRGAIPNRVGTNGADTITGTGGRDVIVALGGEDRAVAGPGDDLVCAGNGNDRVFTRAGADRVLGQGGSDRVFGGPGSDRLFGQGGFDRIFGNAQADSLFGGGQGDRLFGGAGFDRILGGPGWDRGFGGAGRDLLLGHAGRDRLFGGLGRDALRGLAGRPDRCFGGIGQDAPGAAGCELRVSIP